MVHRQQDPYRITLFGKSRQRIEVVDADFLPHEKHLYIVVADGDENLQVLEYDNEGWLCRVCCEVQMLMVGCRSSVTRWPTTSQQSSIPHRPVPSRTPPPTFYLLYRSPESGQQWRRHEWDNYWRRRIDAWSLEPHPDADAIWRNKSDQSCR